MIVTLRSAKIPARYVYGTIDLPIEQVMNWVGGEQNVEAAPQNQQAAIFNGMTGENLSGKIPAGFIPDITECRRFP